MSIMTYRYVISSIFLGLTLSLVIIPTPHLIGTVAQHVSDCEAAGASELPSASWNSLLDAAEADTFVGDRATIKFLIVCE